MKSNILIISVLALMAIACKKEDEVPAPTPPRDVTEVRDENDKAIVSYLKTHFYTFENEEVTLDTIAGVNKNATPLSNQVKALELDVLDANNVKVRHKLYYLIVREGSGNQSTIADSVYVAYKGQLLNGKVFDQTVSYTSSNWMDLLGNQTQNNRGVMRGFREAMAQLKASNTGFSMNNDGTINVAKDGGVGIFFIPSGLMYFNVSVSSIKPYSPLIFSVNLLKTKNADHDNDGIPSIKEIKREDYGIVTYPNCDNDSFVDYIDADKCN